MTARLKVGLICLTVELLLGPSCNCGGASGVVEQSDGGSGATGGSSGVDATGASSGSGSGGTTGASSGSGGTSGGCGLRTCHSASADCGLIGDGCGSSLDCGSCTPPETCGGGGKPSVCGGDGGCIARSCASVGANCGPLADGCGSLLQCGGCDAGSCGGGGQPNVCGGSGVGGDGGSQLGADGGCQPLTCGTLGFNCGPAGDGCGKPLQCGTSCDGGSCGGGGQPGVCGGVPPCQPKSCSDYSFSCGMIGDGCGNLLPCGSCDAGACGAGGTPGACGALPVCLPTGCGNANCGFVGNGCGAIVGPCGSCTLPQICGGGGVPNQCGDSNAVDAGSCTNLCPYQTSCSDGGTTVVTGTVVAGTKPDAGFGEPDPLPGALVYVPNGTPEPFTPGVACDPCGANASGSPIASATSAVDGGFTLTNVPCGTPNPIPLVIQIGRWRRQVTVGPFACCTTTALPTSETRMPRNSSEGDIPLIALATGNVDSHECILRKMGIDDSEFTAPGIPDAGRVQLWLGNGASDPQGVNAPELTLTSTPSMLQQYDQVMFPCWGSEDGQPASPDQPVMQVAQNQQNVIDYADEGGRIYGTHFSYVWLDNDTNENGRLPLGPVPFDGTADWDLNAGTWTSTCGTRRNPLPCPVNIDQSFPKGALLAQWLQVVGASTMLGVIPQLDNPRWDMDNVVIPPSENWLQWPGNPTPLESYTPLHYTFNTPVGADGGLKCGRVVFSDFHVENAKSTNGKTFPGECSNTPMSAQEKVLEFMLFDLASCIVQTGSPPAVCAPLSCAQQGFNCGAQGDGCGNAIQCGGCDAGICGGGGPGVCGEGCTPLTCQQLGLSCGPAGDGCGNVIPCGDCTFPDVCGGGGTPGVCGAVPCSKLTCAMLGYDCGPAGDGCGGQLNCGGCDGGSCGGGGVPGVCGSGTNCVPLTCTGQGLQCGPAGDGCGGVIDGGCGSCMAFEGVSNATCGGGGQPGVCGTPSCTPLTCAGLNFNCGPAGDGCGELLQCGLCDAGSCGGGGQPNVCGSTIFH